VVREALQVLGGKGLIVNDPYCGQSVIQIDDKETEGLFVVRVSLESVAACPWRIDKIIAAIGVWYNPRQCLCQVYELKSIGDTDLWVVKTPSTEESITGASGFSACPFSSGNPAL
jgi:hypothetical protein